MYVFAVDGITEITNSFKCILFFNLKYQDLSVTTLQHHDLSVTFYWSYGLPVTDDERKLCL